MRQYSGLTAACTGHNQQRTIDMFGSFALHGVQAIERDRLDTRVRVTRRIWGAFGFGLTRFANHRFGGTEQVVVIEKAAAVTHEQAILENGCSRDRTIRKQKSGGEQRPFWPLPTTRSGIAGGNI